MSTVDDAPTVISSPADTGPPSDARADASGSFEADAELARVDRYLLLHSLGRGAFGLVRAAYDPELDRKVAIKLLRRGGTGTAGSTPPGPRALLEEARMAAKLAHPNVVAVHDVGTLPAGDGASADGIYIVMEHLGGPALLDWVEDRAHPRTWQEVLAVMLAAGEGLAAAHAVGMVHRDFKPPNLRFGDDGRIRVLDFGLASLVAHLQRDVDTVAGTPSYISPEMHVGRPADARARRRARRSIRILRRAVALLVRPGAVRR